MGARPTVTRASCSEAPSPALKELTFGGEEGKGVSSGQGKGKKGVVVLFVFYAPPGFLREACTKLSG